MRQRITRNKQADPYTLGRSKENPPAEKYMNGDPSSWAEDPDMSHPWEKEKREETGHAAENKDMSGDFGKESPKSAAIKSAKELKAKAIKCIRIAEAMFPTASETVWEEQGFALMELSDRAIQATLDLIEQHAAPAEEAKVAAEKVAEEDEEEDEDEMSEQEKKAGLLVKRANSLNAEAQFQEALGQADKAESLKKEARSVLATAKKVLAGELPEALKEHMFGDKKEEGGEKKEEEKKEAAAPAAAPAVTEKKAEEAPADMSKGAPVDASGKPEDAVPADKDMTVTAKAAEANRLLEAAKKLMAEVEAAQTPATKVAEGMDADVSNSEVPAEMKEEAKEEDEEEAKEEDEDESAMEEEEEAHEHDFGMGDMVPQSDDHGLDGLFMTPEMQDAKEAYEAAFGMKTDDAAPMAGPMAPAMAAPMAPPAAPAADAPAAPGLDHMKGASKTASAKKGAKSLKAGIKISGSQSAHDLENLWDSPPDVSHLFK